MVSHVARGSQDNKYHAHSAGCIVLIELAAGSMVSKVSCVHGFYRWKQRASNDSKTYGSIENFSFFRWHTSCQLATTYEKLRTEMNQDVGVYGFLVCVERIESKKEPDLAHILSLSVVLLYLSPAIFRANCHLFHPLHGKREIIPFSPKEKKKMTCVPHTSPLRNKRQSLRNWMG